MIISVCVVQPRSLSVGCSLSFAADVLLLGGPDPVGNWPEVVAAHAIGCRSCILMAILLIFAGAAVVLGVNGVMAAGPAVAAHIARVSELPCFTTAAAAAVASAAAASVASVATAASAAVLLVC
jgi:hypothetical protein